MFRQSSTESKKDGVFVLCGVWSAWLYDLLHSRVDQLVVCNPRKNALRKDGNKSDRIDARKLADLLRGNRLNGLRVSQIDLMPADHSPRGRNYQKR